jgi:AraC-like DNA-binding protein
MPDSLQFCSIEEMQANVDALGWSASYRQLQAGKLLAWSYSGACCGITLTDEFVSRQIEVVGATPNAHITVAASITSARVWINGRNIDQSGVLCLPPGVEMHGVPSENARVLTVHVPITLLQMAGLDTCDPWTRLIGGESVYVEPDGAAVTNFRQLVHAAIHEPLPASERTVRASELLMRVSSVVCAPFEGQSYSRRDSVYEKHRVVKRAREFIEAHLFEPIQIGDVCHCAATSVSKLERTFQCELQMSPSQYILTRRLVAANKALKQNSSDNTHVTQVAMEYGFNHLGRFAGAYNKHFGELPSKTLSYT